MDGDGPRIYGPWSGTTYEIETHHRAATIHANATHGLPWAGGHHHLGDDADPRRHQRAERRKQSRVPARFPPWIVRVRDGTVWTTIQLLWTPRPAPCHYSCSAARRWAWATCCGAMGAVPSASTAATSVWDLEGGGVPRAHTNTQTHKHTPVCGAVGYRGRAARQEARPPAPTVAVARPPVHPQSPRQAPPHQRQPANSGSW